MEVLKSSRFWLAVVALALIGTFTILGKLSGEAASGYLMTLLAGFGVAKAGGGNDTKGGSIAPLLLVALIPLASCNATFETQVDRVNQSVKMVSDISMPLFHRACMGAADECSKAGKKAADCDKWQKCDKAREVVHGLLDVAQVGCSTAIALNAVDKKAEAREKILAAEQALVKAYDMLAHNGLFDWSK